MEKKLAIQLAVQRNRKGGLSLPQQLSSAGGAKEPQGAALLYSRWPCKGSTGGGPSLLQAREHLVVENRDQLVVRQDRAERLPEPRLLI